jgi:hypothetical protein
VLDAKKGEALNAALNKTFMYIARGSPAMIVLRDIRLTHRKTLMVLQTFNLSGLGNRQGFQGMAIYPSS